MARFRTEGGVSVEADRVVDAPPPARAPADAWADLRAEAFRVRSLHNDSAGAGRLLLRARQVAEAAGDVVRAVDVELSRGTCGDHLGDPGALGESAEYALRALGTRHEPALAAVAHAMLAIAASRRGDAQTLLSELAIARALIDSVDVPSTQLVRAISLAADAYLVLGSHADAHALYSQLLRLCPEVDGGHAAGLAHCWLAIITFQWSEHLVPVAPRRARLLMRECRAVARAALAAGRALGSDFLVTKALPYLALAEASLDQAPAALARLDDCTLELTDVDLLVALLARCRAHRVLDDTAAARATFAELVRCEDAIAKAPGLALAVRQERLALARRQGDVAAQLQLFEESLAEERRRRVAESDRHAGAIAAQVRAAAAQLALTALDRQIVTLTDLSRTDALTGLLNRRGLQHALAEPARSGRTVGVVLLDVDHFKNINDTLSYRVGDDVLATVAGVLRECSRHDDLVARYGGDEFVIVTRDPAACAQVAERCRSAVQVHDWTVTVPKTPISLSVGIASAVASPDLAALLRDADVALHAAKAQGRDRVVGAAG